MLKNKLAKLVRDPNLFFEDYFALRRKRAKAGGGKWRKLAAEGLRLSSTVRDALQPGALGLQSKTILYESFNGSRMSCNPYAMFKYMLADPRFAGYRHVWVLDQPERFKHKLKSHRNVELVTRNSARHQHYMEVAKYLVSNNTFPASFSKREGQVYVNTQHGVPIKTMGRDAKQTFGLGANVTRNFLHADFLVMPNRYTSDVMLRAHDVQNLFPGQIIETGYPRCDLTRRDEAFQRELRTLLDIPDGKKVLLYAPTYRGDFRASVDRSIEVAEFVGKLEGHLGNDYVVIYKGHHVDKAAGDARSEHVDALDTNELLSIVDVLITDYSSIAFDFFAQRKPIIYFAYDVDDYAAARGLYLDVHDLPGVVCRDTQSVLAQLEQLDGFMSRHAASYDAAIETYCKREDGNVTKRVVETIFLGKPCAETYRVPPSAKQKIIIYGGGFLNNGVTSSVSSLLKSLDRDKLDVYVAFNRGASAENTARFQARVPQDIKVLFYLKTNEPADYDIHRHCLKEARRLFGDARFDVAVDASGYGRLWPGVIANVHAKKRYIFLHNCMKSEQTLRPHLADFDYLFELYEHKYDSLVSVSESSFEANAEHLPHLKDKMVFVENTLDDERVKALAHESDVDPACTNFINIGRYDYQKGQDRLVTAFAQVHKRHPNTRLYLVGYGPDAKPLERQVRALGLTEVVFITGKMENPFRLLEQCDCFVMSSRYEGQGIVLLEALTLGIPCISTDIPGPRSILDEEFLYPDSEDGLERGMLDFLAGRVRLQAFDPRRYNEAPKAKLNRLILGAAADAEQDWEG